MIKTSFASLLSVLVILLYFGVLCSDAISKDDRGICEYTKTEKITKRIYKGKGCKENCYKEVVYTKTNDVELKCCRGWEWVDDEGACYPLCLPDGCVNGTCIAPSVCHCDPPLVLNKHACILPTCNPACGLNQWCTGDSICSCVQGYYSINTTHCAPKCPTGFFNDPIECKSMCNSTCSNATCTAPDTCSCIKGHQKFNESTCIPECSPNCENGECIAPNICKCFDGYINVTLSKCIPKCDKCKNGKCVAPNNCECNKGYEKQGGICTPACKQPCKNGTCSEPNLCTCKLGYTLDPANKYNCLPKCEFNCVNASCASPNVCSCHDGYYMTADNRTCRPKCDDCKNGECFAPNDCRCHIGFLRDGSTCKPICKTPCKNGICTGPDECSCLVGYKMDLTDNFNCQPHCNKSCINSTCVSPETCQCLSGYEPTGEKNICKPICASCNNGQCVLPGVCVCNEGFILTEGNCRPTCTPSCINGNCSDLDTCTCEKGFIQSTTDRHVCYKNCDGSCTNGACTLRGECICDSRFHLINGSCIEKESVNCESCLTNCTDNNCSCSDGSPCPPRLIASDGMASTANLAGLELTWVLGGAIGLLLFVLLSAIIIHMSRKRNYQENKMADIGGVVGSVVYTVPDTLTIPRPFSDLVAHEDVMYDEVSTARHRTDDDEDGTDERLLNGQSHHERL